MSKEKLSQIQFLSNAIIFVDQRSAFKSFGVSCWPLYSTWGIGEWKSSTARAWEKLVQLSEFWQFWFNSPGWFKLSAAICSFVWHLTIQWPDKCLCCALSILVSKLASRNLAQAELKSLHDHHTSSALENFRTWSRVRVSLCPHVLAWSMGIMQLLHSLEA